MIFFLRFHGLTRGISNTSSNRSILCWASFEKRSLIDSRFSRQPMDGLQPGWCQRLSLRTQSMISRPPRRIQAIDDEPVSTMIRCSPVTQVHRRWQISRVKTAMMMIGKDEFMPLINDWAFVARRFSSITETTDSSSNYHRRRRRRRQHHHQPHRRQRVMIVEKILSRISTSNSFFRLHRWAVWRIRQYRWMWSRLLSAWVRSLACFFHSNDTCLSNRTDQISWHDCRRRIGWWYHRWVHHERVRKNARSDRSASPFLFLF